MPEYHLAAKELKNENVIIVAVFKLRDGLACVVSWAFPEPGLRPFNPTPSDPDAASHALPYAQFLREHLGALKVVVDLQDGVEWNPAWGTLTT